MPLSRRTIDTLGLLLRVACRTANGSLRQLLAYEGDDVEDVFGLDFRYSYEFFG